MEIYNLYVWLGRKATSTHSLTHYNMENLYFKKPNLCPTYFYYVI